MYNPGSWYGFTLLSNVSIRLVTVFIIADGNCSQMSLGNLQKAWLRLRQFIAVAELMGLPKTFQTVQQNKARGLPNDEVQLQRAQLWESLSAADGLSGMVINLPPAINPYRLIKAPILSPNGEVVPRAYLGKLTEITTKIQYDDTGIAHGSTGDLYASVLELDRQLQALYTQTPKSWWVQKADHVEADQVVQFLHFCVKMRIHLSFAMRQDLDKEHIYSRLACTDACESIAERYQFLRRELPAGIFICQLLDLQAFTATVVLLLTSHNSTSMDRSMSSMNRAKVDGLVARFVKTMEENFTMNPGFGFAQHGVAAIRSLNKLLQQDRESSDLQELSLKIPLLGKVHIRRNSALRAPKPASFQAPVSSGPWTSNELVVSLGGAQPQNNLDTQMESFQAQGQFQWDPVSWSVEDHFEDFFQDPLIAGGANQFDMWQDSQGDFNFSG